VDGVPREVAGQKQAIWVSDLEVLAEIMFNLMFLSKVHRCMSMVSNLEAVCI
jgi:hypothetical protein